MKKIWIVFIMLFIASGVTLAQRTKTENVILITLDGMRWQEIFLGPEDRLITHKFVDDTVALAKQYAGLSPAERRSKLLPFFWNVIAKEGQLYGNRTLGNNVNTSNKMWFSYPGYNEILTGAADDARINSNDGVDNPNANVLEFINQQKAFAGKVAAFTSWETFPWIINVNRNHLPVNSGWMKAQSPNEQEKLLDDLSGQLPNFTGGTRLDGLTFHYGFEYLKKNHPRVMYFSFDETDHFAHEGNYDRYLTSAHYIDGFIATLWNWLQQQEQYKNKTTLIITTDHGRGNKTKDDWRHHGQKAIDSDQIWFAFLGPDTAGRGEVKENQQLYQNQIAATIAHLLGLEFKRDVVIGAPVSTAVPKH